MMRKPRLSLYGQILFWFFLNLALVAAVLFLVLRVQFNVGFESLLSGRVGERMETIGEVMSADLREMPSQDWEEIIQRYEAAYRVEFMVLRPDGEPLPDQADGVVPARLKAILEAVALGAAGRVGRIGPDLAARRAPRDTPTAASDRCGGVHLGR
jgi:hypothetical protein